MGLGSNTTDVCHGSEEPSGPGVPEHRPCAEGGGRERDLAGLSHHFLPPQGLWQRHAHDEGEPSAVVPRPQAHLDGGGRGESGIA